MAKNRWFNLLIVIGLVAVIVLTVREAVATSVVVQQVKEAQGIQRGRQAEAARWAAQAEFYARIAQQEKAAQGIQRGREAEAARWAAQAEFYTKVARSIQRNYEAEAARWAAQAEYYAKLAPPRTGVQEHLGLLNLINAARYTGEALLEFERTGNRNTLPTCISAETLAELPQTIGGNRLKSLVPVCGQ